MNVLMYALTPYNTHYQILFGNNHGDLKLKCGPMYICIKNDNLSVEIKQN